MDLPLHELKVLLDDLKLLAEDRGIKGYKSMSGERLLSVLSKTKLIRKSHLSIHNEWDSLLNQNVMSLAWLQWIHYIKIMN